MAKLSAATRHALSVVAYDVIAQGIEQNVMKTNGLEGYYDNWLKTQSPANRAIIQEFKEMSREIYQDLKRLVEEEAKP